MNELSRMIRKFRAQPAFTGFVLFMFALILNIVVQGLSCCAGGKASLSNFFSFFKPSYLNTLFMANLPFIMVTVGQALLLIVGEMDVSIGIQLALVNVVCIMVPQETGAPFWVGCLCGLGAALAASALCGFCCAALRLPALLASYAMTYIIKGVNVLIMDVPQGSVPKAIWKPYQSTIYGLLEDPPAILKFLDYIPVAAVILAIVLLIWNFISKTRFGKHIYAVGSNPRNAFVAGISPVGTKMKAFLIKGFFVAVGGIALTLMSTSGNPLQCEEYGIKSLSGAIIGGMGWGGWGSVSCGVFGGGFLVLIQNTVYFFFTFLSKVIPGFAVSSYWQNLVSDIIIFAGLLMTIITTKGQAETLKQGIKQQFKRGESIVK